MRKSRVLEKLRSGKPAMGVSVNLGPSLAASGLVGRLGYDFSFIDMEHRWIGYKEAALMSLATRDGGADSMIRIADTNYSSFHRCYEVGTAGVLMPHVTSAAKAEHAVQCCKFFPEGQRGLDPTNMDSDFGHGGSIKEITEWHNRESFIALQIEDREGVENIDEIAAVSGVDVLFIGPADLSQSFGKPGEFDAPEIRESFVKVAKAAEDNKIWWGAPAIHSVDKLKSYLDMGARFLLAASDFYSYKTTLMKHVDDISNILVKEGLS